MTSENNYGTWLGASDYIEQSKFIEILLEQLLRTHEDLGIIQRKYGYLVDKYNELLDKSYEQGRVPPTRKIYFQKLRARVQTGEVNLLEALRNLPWILFKSQNIQSQAHKFVGKKIIGQNVQRYRSSYSDDTPIRTAISQGNYEVAYAWGRALFPVHSNNKKFVQLIEQAATRRGNISQTVALVNYRHLKGWVNPKANRVAAGRTNELYALPVDLGKHFIPESSRNKKVILHLVKESMPYRANGFCARSQHNLVAEKSAGYQPIVLTEPGFPEATNWSGDSVEYVDGIEHRRLLPGLDSISKELPFDEFHKLFAMLALNEIKKIRPEVIHVSSGRRGAETAMVGLALSRATGIPLVYEMRSFFEGTWTAESTRQETGELFEARKKMELTCASNAHQVISICESMKKELVSWGIDSNKITVVPNGVDLDMFTPAPKNMELVDSLNLKGSLVFGYVSNLDHPRESQETLVEALKILKNRKRNVKCLLVGKGPRSAQIKQVAERLQVSQDLILTGSIPHDQVVDYYRLIDIFVVPRKEERAARLITPLKPFEAMACKLPLVVSELPALEEIVDSPRRGLSFPEQNAEELANVIEELIDNPKKRAEIAESGYNWVRQERQWSLNSSKYDSVYKKAKRKK